MKKLIYTVLVLSFIGISSCTDLDVEPKNTLLENTAFTEERAYTSYLAKLYASFTLTGQQGPAGDRDIAIISDEGFTSYLRAYWKAQELPTDEALIRWQDAGIQDLNTHAWSSDNQFIRVLYYRIFYTVSLCNDFLRVATDELMQERGIPQQFQNEVAIYRFEARFLRALAYWHALDLFRNVAYITELGTELPSQVSPQVLFNQIDAELQACIAGLPAPAEAEYGRASKAAARMLRAKLYLNASVYLSNPPANAMDVVVEEVNGVINSAQYGLEPVYLDLFKADNDMSGEIIWAMSQDGINSQSWGATTFMVRAMIYEDYMDATQYGVLSGWSGVRTTPQFVDLFESSPGVLDTLDGRNVIYTTNRIAEEVDTTGDILDLDVGYLMPKYSNKTRDSVDGSDGDHVDTDYPYFRYADALMMYAEAVLRGAGNGDLGTALTYVNQIRARAGAPAINAGELNLNFILAERGREFYYEACRRVDLIRFGVFSADGGGDEANWFWKGGVKEGRSISEHLEIYPIPAFDLGVNPNLTQNPGY